jgi:hypothetical protein
LHLLETTQPLQITSGNHLNPPVKSAMNRFQGVFGLLLLICFYSCAPASRGQYKLLKPGQVWSVSGKLPGKELGLFDALIFRLRDSPSTDKNGILGFSAQEDSVSVGPKVAYAALLYDPNDSKTEFLLASMEFIDAVGSRIDRFCMSLEPSKNPDQETFQGAYTANMDLLRGFVEKNDRRDLGECTIEMVK